MKAYEEEHFRSKPEGLTEEQAAEWWFKRMCALWMIIPMRCINRFDLPSVDGRTITTVHDGDDIVCVVTLADTATRATSVPPSDEVIAEVAKHIHQENDQPRRYRVANMGD